MKFVTVGDIVLALAARIVPGFLALLAVPFYVHSLGPQSYAAVGFFVTIQIFVGLLDFGVSTAVLREASWLTGQHSPAERFWTLLHTFEMPFWGVTCAVIAVGVLFGQTLLTSIFAIDPSIVGLEFPAAFLLFSAIACRFPFAVYFAYLSGRGHVATANLIVLVFDTLRTVGTVILLLVFVPSLTLFFGWQALAALLMSLVGLWMARRASPPTQLATPVDWSLFRDLRNLAVGSGLMSVLFVSSNSLDKMFLPRFLTIQDYGLYIAVAQLAIAVFLVTHAVWSAQNPRLLIAMSTGNMKRALDVYHSTASLMSGLSGAIILGVWLSAPAIVDVWIGASQRERFSSVLVVLTIGNAAAALSHLTLSVQQAAKTMMPLLPVLAASVFGIPVAALLVSDGFTALSGAIVWSGIFVGFLLGGIATYLEHGAGFMRIWLQAVLMPLVLAICFAAFLSQWTHTFSDYAQMGAGLCAGFVAFAVNVMTNAQVRDSIKRLLFAGTPSRDKTA